MPRTILLIDDAPEVLELAQLGLELGGDWSCLTASNAPDGLQEAQKGPDVILLDFELQDWNGLAVLEKLKQDPRTRGIPVIFLTSLSGPGDRQRYLEAGARGVLTKPFDPMRLAQQVDELLR